MDINDYATIIPILLGILAPASASFLSRQHWPSEVTAGLTVLCSAACGFIGEAFAAGDFRIGSALAKAGAAYVLAALARSQFWAKTDTDAKLLAFPRKLPPGNVQPGAEPDALADHVAEHAA